MRIVIVGGVAGGAGAAAKARRVSESAEITMFERGPYVSFANCGLPYYIGGDIPQRDALLLQSPESFWRRFRVQVKTRHEVLRINRPAKSVDVRELAGGRVFSQPYDKLILAPGAGAIIPPLPGISAKNLFTVKTVPDSDAVRQYLSERRPKRAVVIGGGFIGLEAAEALHKRGLHVTVIEREAQVLPPFDPDVAMFVSQHVEAAGIALVLGDGVKAFHGGDVATEVELTSGRRLPMDLGILSIGVRPELKLAQDAGLTIGAAGGIAVNDRQQTSDPDIYAAGDAVEVVHGVTGQAARVPLAGPANKQGRVAGANAAGGDLRFSGTLGTAIVETLGLAAAKTGLSERDAKRAGLAHYVSITHSADHATYYPGSALLHLKLVVEQSTGRLLGAQVVGERGVDKRIDVLATALAARMTVGDLEQLDLAYAPQFSSAKDPVVMAGFVAANVWREDVQTITCEALHTRLAAGEPLQIVDVRTPMEHAAGHLPQAVLIPVDEVRERLGELDPARETVVYCRVGLRGYLAARILRQHDFTRVLNLTGGLLACPVPAPEDAVPAAGNGHAGAAAVSPAETRQALSRKLAMVIDVREPDEFVYERVEGTVNVPFGTLSAQAGTLAGSGPVYLLCQTGRRAQDAAQLLSQAGCRDVRVVAGGLSSWKETGLPVRRSGGPIPIMRQVQIVAGSLVLIGGLVPGGRWVAAVVGAGLIFAGASGWCGMAMLLARLPWNRPRRPGRDAGNPPAPSCGPA